MPESIKMDRNTFVTCDLLDANPESQVCLPNIEGKSFRQFGAKNKFFGEIVTVKCFEDNSRVKALLNSDGKDKDGNGKVLVVDGGGSMRCALLGDMIAESAIDNGWAGVVIYGCVRDVDDLAQMGIGVMALGCIPRKSNRRDEGQTGIEISFGDLTLNSGMFVYADNNGIIASVSPLI
ncbi:ribonuclease E activity regulator RraA [Psychrobacter sp. NG254]|uniref:ribonuclease E activity regulator RraA n=1 Tax=Psychrobacter sp. NG254 TaxID=2782003 RepID=UPI001886B4A3|nr:ribonuclease E activity regulator RraA [Psychrobacter sp. NG254]MBF2718439.1 ribonuclease E activity regulator RraA [Psychrobacter sp. NG254]